MFRRRTWSTACACGEPLTAQSREGLKGLLRVHVLLDHGAIRGDPVVDEDGLELESLTR